MVSSALIGSIYDEAQPGNIGRLKQRVTQYISEKCTEGTDYVALPFKKLDEELRLVFEDINVQTKASSKQVANANRANLEKFPVVFIRGDVLKAAVVAKNAIAKIVIGTMRTASLLTMFATSADPEADPVIKKSEISLAQLTRLTTEHVTLTKPKTPSAPKPISDEASGAPCFILIVSNETVDVDGVPDGHMALLVKTDLLRLRVVAHNLVATLLPSFYAVTVFALPSADSTEWDNVTASTIVQYLVTKHVARAAPQGSTAARLDMSSDMFVFSGDMSPSNGKQTTRKLDKRINGYLSSFIDSSNVQVTETCAGSLYSSRQRFEHVTRFLTATYVFYDSHFYEKMPTGKNADRKTWTERMSELPSVQDRTLYESYHDYCDDMHVPQILRIEQCTLFATLKHLGLHKCNDRYLLIRSIADDMRPDPEGMPPVAVDTVLKALKESKSKKNKFDPILLCDADARSKITARLKPKRIAAPKRRRETASSSAASSKKTRTALSTPEPTAESSEDENAEEAPTEL
jgi:hypothetical protein